MKVNVENGKVSVQSAYNADWVKRAKELGGKWNAPCWVFPEQNQELVREALMDIYGEDGRPAEKVTVDITIEKDRNIRRSELVIGGVTVLRRRGRDTAVSCENGTVIVSGKFWETNGSRANPVIGSPKEDDVVIRASFPKAKLPGIAEEWPVKAVEFAKVNKEALLEEKLALLKRIEEIDKLIAG